VNDLSHVFERESKRVEALVDINLRIDGGEFVSILGPSGCGKSTLMLLIAGLLSPTAGEIRIEDVKVDRPYTNLGIVFQDPSLLSWRTALRNILIQAEVRKMEMGSARARAVDLMEATGLGGFEDAYPSELSGGMRQRVAICRAVLHDPPLLLMDEPFGALDALTREQMVLDLQSLWLRNRKTVVFITHDIAEAVFLSDRVIVLSARPGRILDALDVTLPRPRRFESKELASFVELEGRIRSLLVQYGVISDQGPTPAGG
jgi:NitT/TauT family transport system ATP-binding protein